METKILIDGIDRTELIRPQSIRYLGNLRKGFGDTLDFIIRQAPGDFKVKGGSRIDFFLPGKVDPFFTGFVDAVIPARYSVGSWEYSCRSFGPEQIFYRRNVQAVLRNQTYKASINQILKNPNHNWPANLYRDVVDLHGVLDDVINYYSINGAFAYQVFDLFSELTNSAWLVRFNSQTSLFELVFYNPMTNMRGLSFTQNSENFHFKTFEPSFDLQQVVNQQTVRGGQIPAPDAITAYFRGDNLSSRFDLPTKPFDNETNIVLADLFAGTSINEDLWAEYDPQDFVYLTNDGFLQFDPQSENEDWVGLRSNIFASRAKGPSCSFDFTWVANGECLMGLSVLDLIEGPESLEAGFYIDGDGLVHLVADGVPEATGLTLEGGSHYRLKMLFSPSGGASFEYQSGEDVMTRNWTELGSSIYGSETTLSTVVYTKTGEFSISSIKTRYPYLGINLLVDRGTGFQREDVGLYPMDQDMDAVILDGQVLAFWGSDPGPSTVPPSPSNFKREISSVNTENNIFTCTHYRQTGDQVIFSTSGTLPAPLVVTGAYYARRLSENTFAVYPTPEDAQNDTNRIDIEDSGTGTHSVAPGPEYRNIQVTYAESRQIIAQAQDGASVIEIASLFENDDGIRDGAVIVDPTITSHEVAYARAMTEVENRKNVINKVSLSTMWSHLTDKNLPEAPKPGHTVRFDVTLPVVSHVIRVNYPISRLEMRANKTGEDFEISLIGSHFRRGMLDIFRAMRDSGELIALSEVGSVNILSSLMESVGVSDNLQKVYKTTRSKWGDSRFNRTFTVDPGTDVLTTATDHPYSTGDLVAFSSTDELPGGLEAFVGFYVRKLSDTTLTIHMSPDDAVSGENVLDITSAGTGTHTIKSHGWRWNFHHWGSFQ